MNEWYREYLPVDEYLGQELGGVIERRGNGNGEGGEFDRVIYVGDGSNDFCPLLSLKRSPFPFLSFHFPPSDGITEIASDTVPITRSLGKEGV